MVCHQPGLCGILETTYRWREWELRPHRLMANCTSHAAEPSLSQPHPYCVWTSTTVGPPMVQEVRCHRTSTLPGPLLSQNLHFHSTSTETGLLLCQHLHCCSLISTVSGPPSLQEIQYCRTSNVKDLHCCSTCSVPASPMLQELQSPRNSTVKGSSQYQDLTFHSAITIKGPS